MAAWLVVVAALAAANLPFVNESAFGFIPMPRRRPVVVAGGVRTKPFVVRLLELVVLYFIVGALAYALEARIGNVFSQTREFYWITVPMFLVLAFPGFVLRYLRKRRG